MSIAITLRRSAAQSHFADALIGAIGASNNIELMLCSGFISEGVRSEYRVTAQPGFLDNISNNCSSVTTVGVYGRDWRDDYVEFFWTLCEKNITVYPRASLSRGWHAKVAIIRRDDVPVFGIIGSSNLTGPAFGSTGAPGFNYFNYESDVILWDDTDTQINSFMGSYLINRVDDTIRAPYFPALNANLTINQRLSGIWNDVIANTRLDPDLPQPNPPEPEPEPDGLDGPG